MGNDRERPWRLKRHGTLEPIRQGEGLKGSAPHLEELKVNRIGPHETIAAHTLLSTVAENVSLNRRNVAACFGPKNRAFTLERK